MFDQSDTACVVTRQSPLNEEQSDGVATKNPLNSTVRILHVVNGEHYSGAERVQDLLAANLPGQGYEVIFGCVKPGLFNDKRNCRKAELFDVGMRSRFDVGVVKKITKLIEEKGIRLVHAHTPRAALVGGIAARKSGLPFVFHVHSPTSRDSTRWLINWLNQRIENWSIRNARKIVTVSTSLKQHMTELGFDSSQIAVVPNGVPIQPRTRPKTRSSSSFVVGTVALFRPRKGTEILLQALSKLRQENVDVKLLAVGPFETGEYETQLKKMAADLGLEQVIEWTGFTDNVASYFSEMDAFALPSLFGEGLPMVVLEAMSYGVPVVASDVEGIPQAIRHQVDGLIVRASDADDLADKLTELVVCEGLCRELSDAAFQRQKEYFSDVSMARQLSQVYDEILQK